MNKTLHIYTFTRQSETLTMTLDRAATDLELGQPESDGWRYDSHLWSELNVTYPEIVKRWAGR